MPHMQPLSAVITGFGHYLPEKIVPSQEVEARLSANGFKVPKGIIRRLSGVTHRHYTDGGISSDMAARAGLRALRSAGVDPQNVDLMIFASASHDVAEPATANIVQEKVGCWGAHIFDVKNACNSFLNALDIANSFIQTGRAQRALITSGEVLSPVINWEVKDVEDMKLKFASWTLGDGGGACLVEASTDASRGIFPGRFYSDGSQWELSTILSGGTLMKRDLSKWYFECNTDELISLALERLPPLISRALAELEWDPLDIRLVVPHQVSVPVIHKLCQVFDYPTERCAITVDRLGNIAAASIPAALSIAVEQGRVAPGDKVLLIGAAAGFSAGVIPVIL